MKAYFFKIFFILMLCICLSSKCMAKDNTISNEHYTENEIYLILIQSTTEDEKINSIYYLKNALKSGGQITLNKDLHIKLKKIDKDLFNRCIVSDEKGNYYKLPTILNFIGANGWRLHSIELGFYIFVKNKFHFE